MKEVIGLCGVARSGKDTFFTLAEDMLMVKNIVCTRHSLAYALKYELDPLFQSQLKFSSFTEISEQKELSRDVMVAWSNLRRTQDPAYWINSIKSNFTDGFNIITDVRFKNEIDYIKSIGGKVVFLNRRINETQFVPPANTNELTNTLPLSSSADYTLTWNTAGDSEIHTLAHYIEEVFQALGYCNPPQSI